MSVVCFSNFAFKTGAAAARLNDMPLKREWNEVQRLQLPREQTRLAKSKKNLSEMEVVMWDEIGLYSNTGFAHRLENQEILKFSDFSFNACIP